ncbi:MAG TPA: sensor histidine kinase [Tepidisphaeraceae bacterium]|nr:sensor histidine kinase [Tepidisphaeraceae bacterium]
MAKRAMQLGIRGKLVGTLMLAGLLPLALSLVAGAWAIQRVRVQFAGQSFRALAQQHAEHISTLLPAQVNFFRLIGQLPLSLNYLRVASAAPAPPADQIATIEASWPNLGPNDPPLKEILANELAQRWQLIQQQSPYIVEVMVTDRHGRLVAATNKTTDYFQADEAWWQACWAKGRGRTILSDAAFDPSASPPRGAIVVNFNIPIFDSDATIGKDQPIGILKVSLETGWILNELRGTTTAQQGGLGSDVWLIKGDGTRITSQPGGSEKLPTPLMGEVRSMQDGYIVGKAVAGRDVFGFAHVRFPAERLEAPSEWAVVVSGPLETAMAPTQLMLWAVLLAGAGIMLGCFIAGLWIAQRELMRPLLTLRQGARKLEEGHLDYRLRAPGEPGSIFRHDEIGQLAREFNRMAAELERSIGELAQADRLKQQFIDLASHELRTPITYILGVTELAQREGSPESALLSRIRAKAQRLNHIVENMFKLMRTGLFESTLNLGPVDLEHLISAAVHEVGPFVKSRKQKLEVKVPSGMESITADREKLRDVLDNLLSNAIRFSPDGTSLSVVVIDRDTMVEIVVSDSGPGVSPEDLPYVFEPFFRGQTSLTSHTSGEYEYMTRGIGLGLSVVKRFTELHGGTVRAESMATGSKFHILLPKHPTAEPTASKVIQLEAH